MFASRGELQRRFVEIDGIRTHYLVVGNGQPVVMLHGNGESVADWSRTLPHPASGLRVYAIDLPGAGAAISRRSIIRPKVWPIL